MIGLPFEAQKAIVNTLVVDDPESRLLYLQSINNTSGKGTQNSGHKHKWDYKYNTIIQIADKHGLKYFKLSRGKLWEAVLLLGPDDDLYVFFSERNMNRIIGQGKKTHYLILLNLFNKELDNMEPLQTSLPIFDEELEETEEQRVLARKMLDIMETDPKKVIVFAFDTRFIATVNAYAFNTRQQIVWEKDLTDLIEPNYRFVLQDDNIQPATRESNVTREVKREKQRIVRLKS